VFNRTLDSGQPLEVVGVIANHKLRTVGEPADPAIYFSSSQRPAGYNVMMARTDTDERALVGSMRQALNAIDAGVVLMESQTMRDQVNATLLPVRAAAWLVALFSAFALLLSAMGLYGVIAFTVARRTREIGVRLAIGARPGTILALVLRQGLTRCLIGLGIGFALAAAATRMVAGALYGVRAADPLAWSGAAGVLVAVTLAANLVPAWRAMRIDPVRALRAE
jgi:ABC-type antimicrobial peptide transport system permease subunit